MDPQTLKTLYFELLESGFTEHQATTKILSTCVGSKAQAYTLLLSFKNIQREVKSIDCSVNSAKGDNSVEETIVDCMIEDSANSANSANSVKDNRDNSVKDLIIDVFTQEELDIDSKEVISYCEDGITHYFHLKHLFVHCARSHQFVNPFNRRPLPESILSALRNYACSTRILISVPTKDRTLSVYEYEDKLEVIVNILRNNIEDLLENDIVVINSSGIIKSLYDEKPQEGDVIEIVPFLNLKVKTRRLSEMAEYSKQKSRTNVNIYAHIRNKVALELGLNVICEHNGIKFESSSRDRIIDVITNAYKNYNFKTSEYELRTEDASIFVFDPKSFANRVIPGEILYFSERDENVEVSNNIARYSEIAFWNNRSSFLEIVGNNIDVIKCSDWDPKNIKHYINTQLFVVDDITSFFTLNLESISLVPNTFWESIRSGPKSVSNKMFKLLLLSSVTTEFYSDVVMAAGRRYEDVCRSISPNGLSITDEECLVLNHYISSNGECSLALNCILRGPLTYILIGSCINIIALLDSVPLFEVLFSKGFLTIDIVMSILGRYNGSSRFFEWLLTDNKCILNFTIEDFSFFCTLSKDSNTMFSFMDRLSVKDYKVFFSIVFPTCTKRKNARRLISDIRLDVNDINKVNTHTYSYSFELQVKDQRFTDFMSAARKCIYSSSFNPLSYIVPRMSLIDFKLIYSASGTYDAFTILGKCSNQQILELSQDNSNFVQSLLSSGYFYETGDYELFERVLSIVSVKIETIDKWYDENPHNYELFVRNISEDKIKSILNEQIISLRRNYNLIEALCSTKASISVFFPLFITLLEENVPEEEFSPFLCFSNAFRLFCQSCSDSTFKTN